MTMRPEIPLLIEVVLTVFLEHRYVDEQKHYDEKQSPRNIFNSLRTVAEWLGWEPDLYLRRPSGRLLIFRSRPDLFLESDLVDRSPPDC